LKVDDDDEFAVIDFTFAMVYQHEVRKVRTYSEGAEATWGASGIGDPIFYDRSATMPVAVKLSTSPFDSTGEPNPLFGFRVPAEDSDVADAGADTASTQDIAVLQTVGGCWAVAAELIPV